MKTYIKPTANYIELRSEESLAGAGFSSSLGLKDITEPQQITFENLVVFWTKFLRK